MIHLIIGFVKKNKCPSVLMVALAALSSSMNAQVFQAGEGYGLISARQMQITQTEAQLEYLGKNLVAMMADVYEQNLPDPLGPDGEPEAPPAAPTIPQITTGDGTIPRDRNRNPATGRDTFDVWGRKIVYCAWNNGLVTNASAGYIAGAIIGRVYFALISAGPDGVYSQRCSDIWTGGNANPDTSLKSDDIQIVYTKEKIAFNSTAQAFRNAVSSRADFASFATADLVASNNGTFDNRLGMFEVRLLNYSTASEFEKRLYVRNASRVIAAFSGGAVGFDPLTPMVDIFGNLIGGGTANSDLRLRPNFNEQFASSAPNSGALLFQTASMGGASDNHFQTRMRIDRLGNFFYDE